MQPPIHTLFDLYDSNDDFFITLREHKSMNKLNVCMCGLDYMVRSGQGIYYAIMIGSSTYVGMITVGRAKQNSKALFDMFTREVGRDRLVSFLLSRRESYKRRREEKRSQQPGLL